VPRLSPEELSAARRASGRLGGRPARPSVEEARRIALEELTPKALKVLRAHMGEGDEINPGAWRAALRIFEHQFGRAPEQPLDIVTLPNTAAEIRSLSWAQMQILAAQLLAESSASGAAPPITKGVPAIANGDRG